MTALAVVRSAHRLGIVPVVFDTERDVATASRLARVATHPGRGREEVLEALGAIGREVPSDLICTTDAWLRVVAEHRATLAPAFERILHPPNEVLALCLSKDRFAEWCQAQSLSAPRLYRLAEDSPRDGSSLPFPLMLRPAQTQHSNPEAGILKAEELSGMEALDRRLADYRRAGVAPVLSQSLLGRKPTQYSVGLGRAGGRTMTIVTRKLRPPAEACAVGTLVEVTEQPEVEGLGRRAAELLDYQGIAEIEVLRDDVSGENFLVEINARPWSQFALGPAVGRDLLRFVLGDGQAMATSPRGRPLPCWLDFHTDLRVCFNREDGLVRMGRLSVLAYLRSLAHANVFARWCWFDPAPFWRGLFGLVASQLRRLFSG